MSSNNLTPDVKAPAQKQKHLEKPVTGIDDYHSKDIENTFNIIIVVNFPSLEKEMPVQYKRSTKHQVDKTKNEILARYYSQNIKNTEQSQDIKNCKKETSSHL